MPDESNRARDHLANERTFLAWVRTGVAVVVFGFAIGRFAIAIRQFAHVEGRELHGGGVSVWFGMLAIGAGVALTLAGLLRYQQTRVQLENGTFQPASAVVYVVAILTAVFGLALGGYLLHVALGLR